MSDEAVSKEILSILSNLKSNEVVTLSNEAGHYLLEVIKGMQKDGLL